MWPEGIHERGPWGGNYWPGDWPRIKISDMSGCGCCVRPCSEDDDDDDDGGPWVMGRHGVHDIDIYTLPKHTTPA